MPTTKTVERAEPGDAFVAVAAGTCAACEGLVAPGVNRVVVRNSRLYHAEHAPAED